MKSLLKSAAFLLLWPGHGSLTAMAETAAAVSGEVAVDTRAIDLKLPVSGGFIGIPVRVEFHLPIPAAPGSVRLHFDGTVARELTLAPAYEAAGDHSLSFDAANPTAAVGVIASGESIPEGIYTVTLSYREGAAEPFVSNEASGIIVDLTRPALTVPADITTPATGDAGAVVNYANATANDANGIASLTYSAASGSTFPIGVTTVVVTARDPAENATVASFNVTVTGIQIGVEQPVGTDLTDGATAPVDFGPVVAGGTRTLTFTIRNRGTFDLTGLAVTEAPGDSPEDFTAAAPGTALLAPNATTTFTVDFYPTASGARSATLLIANNDPDENPFEINLAGRLATSLETWRQMHFDSTADTGAGADLNDADGDGLVNLLEYATFSHPRAATPTPGAMVRNGNDIEFLYARPSAAPQELNYRVETSTSLTGQWIPVDAAATQVLSDVGSTQQIKTTIPAAGAARLFLRLRVTRL